MKNERKHVSKSSEFKAHTFKRPVGLTTKKVLSKGGDSNSSFFLFLVWKPLADRNLTQKIDKVSLFWLNFERFLCLFGKIYEINGWWDGKSEISFENINSVNIFRFLNILCYFLSLKTQETRWFRHDVIRMHGNLSEFENFWPKIK